MTTPKVDKIKKEPNWSYTIAYAIPLSPKKAFVNGIPKKELLPKADVISIAAVIVFEKCKYFDKSKTTIQVAKNSAHAVTAGRNIDLSTCKSIM